MADSSNHIIQYQVLDLNLANKHRAYELQTQFSELYQQSVLPKLSAWLDENIPQDRVIQIEKLELDLGNIKMTDFEDDVFEKLKTQLESFILSASHPEIVDNKVHQLNTPDAWVEVFLHFLSTGDKSLKVDHQNPVH